MKVAIVGSSPICMIAAIHLAKTGHSVTVIEENVNLGGAWRSSFICDGEIEVDIACHLIENHGCAYSLLSEASGVEFRKLTPQPVKYFLNGRKEKYSSRVSIFREARLRSLQVAAVLVSCVSDFGWRRLDRLRRESPEIKWQIIQKYWEFVCFRFTKVIFGAEVRHPVGGSVAFVNGLSRRALEAGVFFLHSRVTSINSRVIEENVEGLELKTDRGQAIGADLTLLSNSTTLSATDDNFLETHRPNKKFVHIIYFLPSSVIYRIEPYMHFPDDLDVHRATVLDSESAREIGAQRGGKFVMVQFRTADLTANERKEITLKLMKKHGVLSSQCTIEQCEECACFDDFFYSNTDEAPLAAGRYNNGKIRVLNTIGDLGRVCMLLKRDLV